MPLWNEYRVHLADELPSIGSGIRYVSVKLGYKWARVRAHNTRATRIKRIVWDSLHAIPLDQKQEKNK